MNRETCVPIENNTGLIARYFENTGKVK